MAAPLAHDSEHPFGSRAPRAELFARRLRVYRSLYSEHEEERYASDIRRSLTALLGVAPLRLEWIWRPIETFGLANLAAPDWSYEPERDDEVRA